MSIPKRILVNLLLVAILCFILPSWSPLPCSTIVFNKAGNALFLLIAGNIAFNILCPFLVGPKDILGVPITWLVGLLKVIRLFQDFGYRNIIGIILLLLAVVGLQYGDYLNQRGRAVMPVLQSLTVKLPGEPLRQIHHGDQIEVISGSQALFSAEMLQDPQVECLWSAGRGVPHPGVGCSAIYIAPPGKGYDALSLTIQSTCNISLRTTQGITVLIR
jgi:hypothetical protein